MNLSYLLSICLANSTESNEEQSRSSQPEPIQPHLRRFSFHVIQVCKSLFMTDCSSTVALAFAKEREMIALEKLKGLHSIVKLYVPCFLFLWSWQSNEQTKLLIELIKFPDFSPLPNFSTSQRLESSWSDFCMQMSFQFNSRFLSQTVSLPAAFITAENHGKQNFSIKRHPFDVTHDKMIN